jgi:hypothetical protein
MRGIVEVSRVAEKPISPIQYELALISVRILTRGHKGSSQIQEVSKCGAKWNG